MDGGDRHDVRVDGDGARRKKDELMPAKGNYPVPDFDHPDEKQHRRQLAESLRGVLDGKTNNAHDFDLDATSATSTTVLDERVSDISRIVLTGVNDHGIAELASGTVEVLAANITPGQFVVTHLPSTLTRSIRASILS
jgi:hypothetical protein